MPITAAQMEQRRKHIGASDMAAILGLSSHKNAYDIWLAKTGKLNPDEKTSKAAEAGNYLEVAILDWAENDLGTLLRNQYRSAKAYGLPFGSNLDAITQDGIPAEAKSTGILGPAFGEWGEDGTDEVPPHVIIQTHVQMICVQKDHAYVPALIGGRGFAMFRVNEDKTISDVIANAGREFWDNNVQTDTPPSNILPSIETIKRIRREPDSITEISDEIVAKWLTDKDVEKQAKAQAEESKRAVLTALGTAEAGRYSNGLITFLEQTRKETVVSASTFRILRHKKDK